MPIYEYRCQECHYEFERMQKFSDPPVATCPTCDGAVQKLISRSAFHLKGSGWYVTDYARNGGQKSDAPDKGTAEKPAAEKGTEKSDGNAATSASTSTSGSTGESTPKKSPSGTAAA